jgi:hypothetical protein
MKEYQLGEFEEIVLLTTAIDTLSFHLDYISKCKLNIFFLNVNNIIRFTCLSKFLSGCYLFIDE